MSVELDPARNEYLETWGQQLSERYGRPISGPHEIATVLINDPKTRNYLTAVCLVFGLGYVSHKEYVERAHVALKKYHEENGFADVTPELLAEWVNYYCTEVEQYPGT